MTCTLSFRLRNLESVARCVAVLLASDSLLGNTKHVHVRAVE